MLPALTPGEIAAIAAVVVCSLIGTGVRAESRLMLGAIVVALLVPQSPQAVIGWAVMALMIQGIRFLWSGL